MSLKIRTKSALKKILKPFAGHAIRLMHTQLLGKRVFINRYTAKIPIYSRLLKKVDSVMTAASAVAVRKAEYETWIKSNYPSNYLLAKQKTEVAKLKNKPLLSVLVPTYNTDSDYLAECIQSVIDQTYDNWQLCIADDASTDPSVIKTIKRFAKQDKRIDFVVRDKNGHICHATNSALDLAKGEFIALLDHDDVLWPNALYEAVKVINEASPDFIYSDEDKIDEEGKHVDPFFKPDWSPEFLRSINYITHFAVIRRTIVEKAGRFRPGYEGAQDWDLFLRVSRLTQKIHHIPKVLYSWRKSETSTASQPSAKDYAYVNQKKALQDDVEQRGYKAKIEWQIPFSMWRVDYKLKKNYKVSIIIPTKNQYEYIKRCLESIKEFTTYKNFELIVVDTGSTDEKVWDLYEEYKSIFPDFKLLKWKKTFNFSAVCNYGAKDSTGEYLLFLNNDTEVISPSWIEDMLAYAQQEEIGTVGCKLLYPDNKLQHGGVILGVGGMNDTPGIAGHYFPVFIDEPPQDPAQQLYVGGTRNFTAVTAACVMVEKGKFNSVKGFDDKFRIAFNDVDLCLKIYDKGFRNVYLPHVKLYHHESVSVGQPGSKVRDIGEFDKEIKMMIKKWGSLIKNDPFYHPSFRRDIASARLDNGSKKNS